MSYLDKYVLEAVSVTTLTDSFYTRPIRGLLHAVNYRATATTPWLGTALIKVSSTDGTVVALTSAVQLSTAGFNYYPRAAKVTTAAASTAISEKIPVVDERLMFQVTGSTLVGMTGTFHVYINGAVLPST